MRRILFPIIVISLLFSSCQGQENQYNKVEVLERKSAFNLETIDFQEDVPKLYSRYLLMSDGMRYDSIDDGPLTDSMIKYRINNVIIETLDINVPQQEFGFLYKSPELDSLARFGNSYFNILATLTDLNKKPVAFYAETQYDDKDDRATFIREFVQKYGKATYAFCINTQFDQCSYEWVLEDRTIQMETSYGVGFSISTNGESKSGKYYKLEMLILENKHKEDIYKVHIYQFGDSIKFRDQYHTPQEMGLDKEHVFKDDFLLNSKHEEYVKDVYGVYRLINAEDYVIEAIQDEESVNISEEYIMDAAGDVEAEAANEGVID